MLIDILKALLQGITEFLPVSSSAHLLLVSYLFGEEDVSPIASLAAHGGSLLALLYVLRRETLYLLLGGCDALLLRKTPGAFFFRHISLASIPVLVLGALLYYTGIYVHLQQLLVIGLATLLGGIVLWLADKRPARFFCARKLTLRSALFLGLVQTLALIPGASRSGMCLSAARALGFCRTSAARLSFFLSLPVLGAFVAGSLLSLRDGGDSMAIERFFAIMGASSVFSLIGIHLLMELAQRIGYGPFALYRLVLGSTLLAVAVFFP